MPNERTIRTSFVGGEVSPEMYGRLDLDKEQSGLALCQNFVVLPHGPAQSRAGSRFVSVVKALGARLIPFSFSAVQTMAIELGAGYFRFHTHGESLLYGCGILGAELVANNTMRYSALTSLPNWNNGHTGSGTASINIGNVMALKSPSTGNIGQAYQALTTVIGTTYDLVVNFVGQPSLWVFVENTIGNTLTPIGALIAQKLTPGNSLKHTYTLTFTASATTTYIRLAADIAAPFESAYVYAISISAQAFNCTGFDYNASYVQGDYVHDAFDNVYICTQPNTNLEPSNIATFAQYFSSYTPVYSVYNPATAYVAGKICSYGSNAYYCLAASTGNLPTNTAFWYQLPATGEYEIPNHYLAADLFDIHYVQSGDIVTFVHPSYAPMQLERYGNLDWILAGISFASSLTPPATPTVAITHPTAGYPVNRSYIVTSLNQYGQEESLPSTASALASNDLTIDGNYNTISWTAVTGAGFYNVYAQDNGSFGFVGQVQAPALSFADHNITPDQTRSYPLIDSPVPLSSAGNYPAAVGYYEQRRVFAGSNNQPQNLWLTQPGTESNMNYSVPSQGSDALRIRIAALRANVISHVLALLDLIVLTASTEWRIYTPTGDGLTPTTISIKAQSQNGATNVQPVVVNNAALYVAATGGHVRELVYQWQLTGYESNDVSLLATHLFNGHTIKEMAFSRALYPVVWAVNETGKLLGLTYVPDQQVRAWHQHTTTNGLFKSICTITENGFDVLYAIVERVIAGNTVQYIEAFDTRQYDGVLANAFFVDCGISQTFSTPTSSVSGLTWLAGQTVSALLDGKAVTGLTVSSDGTGTVSLPYAASVVTIGLPITAILETLPVSVVGDASLGQGRVKNVNKVWARCVDFCGCQVGPSVSSLVPVAPLAVDSNGNPALANGEFRVNIMPQFTPDGGVVISQNLPLPITVCDVTLEVAFGS
ncbi:hypothetical protein [Methylomonas sp. AM2-LC]|uniref:hypothetical protein n=1 Tax=Methylomonas sp. AM2-LC TaxID=3153301 RepID=UPI003264305A